MEASWLLTKIEKMNDSIIIRYRATFILVMGSPKYVRLGSLNEPKAVSLILFLSNNPDSTIVDLKGISFADTRTSRILDNMTEDGLLSVSYQGKTRTKATYRLTATGYRVAAKLNEIGGIIHEKHGEDGMEGRSIGHDMGHATP